jgi:bacterioferritin
MFNARADQRTLGFLGRALSLELSAVQQYSTQARLAAAWGLTEAAERLQGEAREEMGHVDRIITRMLALQVAPNASQLRPARLGQNLGELLRGDQLLEQELVTLYTEASRHCARQGDADNRLFFETLLAEEQGHGRELAAWLNQIEQPGGALDSRATF